VVAALQADGEHHRDRVAAGIGGELAVKRDRAG